MASATSTLRPVICMPKPREPEPGEVFEALPIKKTRRQGVSAILKRPEDEQFKECLPKSTDPERLVFLKRLLDEFNSGNVSELDQFIVHSLHPQCSLELTTINRVLTGPLALYTLLVSLSESFPNCIIRSSDVCVDDTGEVAMDFSFTGSKLFNLHFLQDDQDCELTDSDSTNSTVAPSILGLVTQRKGSGRVAKKPFKNNMNEKLMDSVVYFDTENPQLSSLGLLWSSAPDMKATGTVLAHLASDCSIDRLVITWTVTQQ